jgi:hypothetical protein
MDSDAATNGDDVLTAIVQDDVGEDDLRDPPIGRLFYKLEADPTPGQSGPYPVELAVRVTGKVLASPKTASDPPVSSSGGGGEDDGPSDVALLAGAIGGIAVGLVGGGALAGVRRRRPA